MKMFAEEGFAVSRIKQEGAPAHPEDIYIHCGCDKCELRWQQQLTAYKEYYGNKRTLGEIKF